MAERRCAGCERKIRFGSEYLEALAIELPLLVCDSCSHDWIRIALSDRPGSGDAVERIIGFADEPGDEASFRGSASALSKDELIDVAFAWRTQARRLRRLLMNIEDLVRDADGCGLDSTVLAMARWPFRLDPPTLEEFQVAQERALERLKAKGTVNE